MVILGLIDSNPLGHSFCQYTFTIKRPERAADRTSSISQEYYCLSLFSHCGKINAHYLTYVAGGRVEVKKDQPTAYFCRIEVKKAQHSSSSLVILQGRNSTLSKIYSRGQVQHSEYRYFIVTGRHITAHSLDIT